MAGWDTSWDSSPFGGPAAEAGPATPSGIRYSNDMGEMGVLSGKGIVDPFFSRNFPVTDSWVKRTHPDRGRWMLDEEKQRASFLADREHLIPFLVPHRFEGKQGQGPARLNRAQLAYGVGLNAAYLQEIFGHIRSTPTHYTWGAFGDAKKDQDTTSDPADGTVAGRLWWDVTGDGVKWKNFFAGEVLEWMLTSPGSLILVDSNKTSSDRITRAEADALGFRSKLTLIPFSWVEDYGLGENGYRWIKLEEIADERRPQMRSDEDGYVHYHILYELMDDKSHRITRWDDDGKQIGEAIYNTLLDTQGRGVLPLIENKFGKHPDIKRLGSGLLRGLDDIVIDLFNLMTEIREAYRNTVFSFLAYRGPDMDGVQSQMESGTKLVHVGDDNTSELKTVAAEPGGVEAGLSMVDTALRAWALSAKRRAMEVQDTAQPNSKSGVALKAEFTLDLVPLMVAIAETLDEVETTAMFYLAQMEGMSVQEANKLMVKRETEFQMEQEATRVARIVGEYLDSVPGMPAELLEAMIERWAESIDFLDLDEPASTDPSKTRREVIIAQAKEIAKADQDARIAQNQFGIMGAAALGQGLGGNRNGGGNGKARTNGTGNPNPRGPSNPAATLPKPPPRASKPRNGR